MFEKEIKSLLLAHGADDCGFCALGEDAAPGFERYGYAVSIVKALSRAVVSTITDRPGMIYFQHYRAVNSKLDQLALDVVSFIESKGAYALPVAASQSVPGNKYGPCLRLATVLTDLPLERKSERAASYPCEGCDICVRACPAGALNSGFDPEKCSSYMKNFRDEGRGAVCGLCMKACPLTRGYISPRDGKREKE